MTKTLKPKSVRLDTGHSRVYFYCVDDPTLHCLQEADIGWFNAMVCSKDGEPISYVGFDRKSELGAQLEAAIHGISAAPLVYRAIDWLQCKHPEYD